MAHTDAASAPKQGNKVRNAQGPLGGYRTARFRVRHGEQIRSHTHERPHVLILLNGTLEEADGEHATHMRPGDIRVSPLGARHDIDFCDDSDCLVVHVASSQLANRTGLTGVDANTFIQNEIAAAQLRRVAELTGQSEHVFLAELHLMHALARLRPDSDGDAPPAWLTDIRVRMLDTDGALTVTRAAQEAHVSREHLSRLFVRYFGCSPSHARRNAALSRALVALKHDQAPLADVALAAGFYDQSHLINTMRSASGFTPGQFRAAGHSA